MFDDTKILIEPDKIVPIKQTLDKLYDKNKEIEFRLRFIYDKIKKRFEPGVSKNDFFSLKGFLETFPFVRTIVNDTVTYYIDSNNKQTDDRKITQENKILYQRKIKEKSIDIPFYFLEVRLGSSTEEFIDSIHPSFKESYKRYRIRTSFEWKDSNLPFTIDLTEIKNSPEDQNSTYEVECELKPSLIKLSSVDLLKESFVGLKLILSFLLHTKVIASDYVIQQFLKKRNELLSLKENKEDNYIVFEPLINKPHDLTIDNMSNLQSYSITNKLNGLGKQALISEFKNVTKNIMFLFNPGEISRTNRYSVVVVSIDELIYTKLQNSIVEGEWLSEPYLSYFSISPDYKELSHKKDQELLAIYDVLVFNGKSVINKIHKDRIHPLEFLRTLNTNLTLKEFFTFDEFVSKEYIIAELLYLQNNYVSQSPKRTAEDIVMYNDGFIFTPTDVGYLDKKKPILKYKFKNKLSIDLLVRYNQEIDGYELCFNNRGNYKPLMVNNQIYEWIDPIAEDLDGFIVEFLILSNIYVGEIPILLLPIMIRDKENPNSVKVVDNIIEIALSDFTLKKFFELLSISSGYQTVFDPKIFSKYQEENLIKFTNQLFLSDIDINSIYSLIDTIDSVQPTLMLGQHTSKPELKKIERLVNDCLTLMRKFHNTKKGELIKSYCKDAIVLDLGYGAGGDNWKYKENNVKQLIGVDPNQEHIEEAKKRLLEMPKPFSSKVTIIHDKAQNFDKYSPQIGNLVGNFDVVAMFFSLTFFFESDSILQKLRRAIDLSLKNDGYFIGTVIDGVTVDRQLNGDLGRIDEKLFSEHKDIEKGTVFEFKNEEGTVCTKIIKEYDTSRFRETKTTESRYNNKIKIQFMESSTVKNEQTEYLVDFQFFTYLMNDTGFRLIKSELFYPPIYLPPVEKILSRLNRLFVFQKLKPLNYLDTGRSERLYVFNDLTMNRIGVIADGSCFFYALKFGIMGQQFLDLNDQREEIKNFRIELSNNLTKEEWLNLKGSMEAVFQKETENRKNPKSLEWHIENKPEFIDKLLKKFKSDLKNTSVWFDSGSMLEYISNFCNLNIVIVNAKTRFPSKQPFFREERSTVFILHISGNHFEGMYSETNKTIFDKETHHIKLLTQYLDSKRD